MNFMSDHVIYIFDWICEKGSYTRIQFCNFKEIHISQLVVELQLQNLLRRLSYYSTNVGKFFNVIASSQIKL